MSVERLAPNTDLHDLCADDGESAKCFFCGEHVEGVVVVWRGWCNPFVVLHPTCAKEFAAELIGDARNATRVIEGKRLSAGVNV